MSEERVYRGHPIASPYSGHRRKERSIRGKHSSGSFWRVAPVQGKAISAKIEQRTEEGQATLITNLLEGEGFEPGKKEKGKGSRSERGPVQVGGGKTHWGIFDHKKKSYGEQVPRKGRCKSSHLQSSTKRGGSRQEKEVKKESRWGGGSARSPYLYENNSWKEGKGNPTDISEKPKHPFRKDPFPLTIRMWGGGEERHAPAACLPPHYF